MKCPCPAYPLLPHLTEYEVELVRFCARHYLDKAKGEILAYVDFPRYEELGNQEIVKTQEHLMRFGLMQGFSSDHIRIPPAVLGAVQRWDNPPLPDYRDRLTKWFWSKRWSLVFYVLFVGLPFLIGWVTILTAVHEWFGVKK